MTSRHLVFKAAAIQYYVGSLRTVLDIVASSEQPRFFWQYLGFCVDLEPVLPDLHHVYLLCCYLLSCDRKSQNVDAYHATTKKPQ